MNERILELARQVWPDPNTSHVNHEKFAELIVRECGRYLDSPEFIGRRDLDWSIVLNEHFGVEE